MSSFSFVSNSVLDIFYPKTCAICQENLTHKEQFYCLACLYDLPFLERHPSMIESIQKIFWGRVEIQKVYSLLTYHKGSHTQTVLHQIKYNNKAKLAEYMGQMMAKILPENQIDYLIPVPLHPKKEKLRGYNQSLLLAKGIQQKTQIPIINNAIKRISGNASQTKFSKYDRWDNVRSIFSATPVNQIKTNTF